MRLMRNAKGKGSLTLYFANEDQLQTLYDRLVAERRGAGGYGEGDPLNGLLDAPFDVSFNGGSNGNDH